jgi:hypothetical protein
MDVSNALRLRMYPGYLKSQLPRLFISIRLKAGA